MFLSRRSRRLSEASGAAASTRLSGTMPAPCLHRRQSQPAAAGNCRPTQRPRGLLARTVGRAGPGLTMLCLLGMAALPTIRGQVSEMEVKAAQLRMAIHSEDCYLGKVVYMLQEEPSLARMIDRNCAPRPTRTTCARLDPGLQWLQLAPLRWRRSH